MADEDVTSELDDNTVDEESAAKLRDEFDRLEKVGAEEAAEDKKQSEPKDEVEDKPEDIKVTDDPKAGDDAAPKDTSKESEGDDSKELKELAKEAYGLTQGEIDTFAEHDGLESALAMLDRRDVAVARRESAGAAKEVQETRVPDPPAKLEPEEPKGMDWGELGKEQFDPEVVKNIEALSAKLDKVTKDYDDLKGQQGTQSEAQFQQEMTAFNSRFDDIVDGLGQPDLFGEDRAKLTTSQISNREAMYDTTGLLMLRADERGLASDLSPTIVKRALNVEFSEHVSKQAADKRKSAIKNQSGRRLGTGDTRSTMMPERAQDWDGEPEDNPVLHKRFNELVAEQ